MMRTKHVVVTVSVTLVFTLVLFALTFIKYGPGLVSSIDPNTDFTSDDTAYEVGIGKATSSEAARAALIARLKTEEGDVVQKPVPKEEVTPASTPVEMVGGIALGDGHISTGPQAGYIFACNQNFGGGGAQTAGEWIVGSKWFPEKKVHVDGNVSWAGTNSISEIEGARIISTNALPAHTTGVFPVSSGDDAYQFDKNPNYITSQTLYAQLLLDPQLAGVPHCVPMGPIGIALDGVPLFSGLDSQGRDAVAHEILDTCDGHPEKTGMYHYHNESDCMGSNEGDSLVAYALDGFGIYGSYENGTKVTNADLDACHGHTHTVMWNGAPKDIFHYHMTDEYPYSVGCFKGIPATISHSSPLEQDAPLPPPTNGGAVPSF